MAESKPLTPTERRVLVATLMLQRLDIPRRPRGGNMGSHSRRRK